MSELQQKLTESGGNLGTLHGHDQILDFGDPAAEFAALQTSCGIVDFSPRTQIDLDGEDSATFLHNLCTNDIKALTPGTGCETFLTNAQGKIIGHGYIYHMPSGCVLETIPGVGDELTAYFDRYIFREKVTPLDHSERWHELVVAGPNAINVLQQAGFSTLPQANYSHVPLEFNNAPLTIRKVDFVAASCFQINALREPLPALWDALTAAGAVPCGATAWEQARIMHGTPLYGIDITEENLPQEVDRNDSAISFTKGCYIGQETVARIDALGHVNKTLCKLHISGETPAAGDEFFAKDDTQRAKSLGTITSVCAAPDQANADGTTSIALGYVRRGSNSPGTEFQGDGFTLSVV